MLFTKMKDLRFLSQIVFLMFKVKFLELNH